MMKLHVYDLINFMFFSIKEFLLNHLGLGLNALQCIARLGCPTLWQILPFDEVVFCRYDKGYISEFMKIQIFPAI